MLYEVITDAQARPFEKNIKRFGETLMSNPALLDKLDATPDKESFIRMYVITSYSIHYTKLYDTGVGTETEDEEDETSSQ